MALLEAAQHLPPVYLRHHHVEQDEVRGDFLQDREPLLRAACLAHRVALHLEVDADVFAHPRVVVDDQHQRTLLGRAARAGTVEEVVEICAAVATVPTGGVEGGHTALVRPLADRALGDAEEFRGLAERQPVGLARRRAPSRKLAAGHRVKLPKALTS